MNKPIRILIVDDSSLMRLGITSIFSDDGQIEIVGEAVDGKQALSMIDELDPDLVTLDVNMPVMDGLTTLKHLMVVNPKPVVMLSSLTSEGSDITFDALRYGAVDFVTKPSKAEDGFDQAKELIVSKVKAAAEVKVDAVRYIRVPENNKDHGSCTQQCHQVVIVGAAEGGYGSLLKIVPALRNDMSSAFLVVLYAERKHVEAFAKYLDSISAIEVRSACHGELVEAGVCYIGSGNDYMTLHQDDGMPTLHVQSAPFDFRKGSVDRTMFSAAEIFGSNVLGIILSGKDSDGVEGLDEILHNGGVGIVQDPASCLFKEMPMSAINQCKPEYVVTDTKISTVISEVFPGNEELRDFDKNVSMEIV